MNEANNNQNSTEQAVNYTACCAPVLHLTLKKYWFDMIKSGVKKEEYREIKDYWVKRLKDMSLEPPFKAFKSFSIIEFKNGYAKNAPTMRVEFKGIRIGKPKIEWCIDAIEFDQDNGSYDDCFIIELGSVLS